MENNVKEPFTACDFCVMYLNSRVLCNGPAINGHLSEHPLFCI